MVEPITVLIVFLIHPQVGYISSLGTSKLFGTILGRPTDCCRSWFACR